MMAAKGLLRAVYVPSEQQEADRQVVRLREQFVRNLRRVKHRIKSFLLQHGIAEPAKVEHDHKHSAVLSLDHMDLKQLMELAEAEDFTFMASYIMADLMTEIQNLFDLQLQAEARLKDDGFIQRV